MSVKLWRPSGLKQFACEAADRERQDNRQNGRNLDRAVGRGGQNVHRLSGF